MPAPVRHWTHVEYLHETVTNPNIHLRGTHSYDSNAWTGSFEESVVRYLHGDEYSRSTWTPPWHIDQLYIGDYVCIAAEAVILMGGNHTHRTDWFISYPFFDKIPENYMEKGDTRIGDAAWIGMRAMLLPGVTLGEGAVVASGAIVTRDVEPYTMVAGNPAKVIRKRFDDETIAKLLALKVYEWPEGKFEAMRKYLCANDLDNLIRASETFDQGRETKE